MAKRKPKLIANLWTIASRAVEEGARYGVNRAYKYLDDPSRDQIIEHVEREVMNALAEVFVWPAVDE